MLRWLGELFRELLSLGGLCTVFRQFNSTRDSTERKILWMGGITAALIIATGIYMSGMISKHQFGKGSLPHRREIVIDYSQPVRDEPRRFKANTHLPTIDEGAASGSLDLATFAPHVDLIHIHDPRVWWESDHDKDDTEDDHIMHHAMEVPFRRLIELVTAAGGLLEVHDAYRDEGVHAKKSLHKAGRALDLTCEDLGLEKLAKLCWAAGFDWVYHEAPAKGGAHIHVSVRRDW